MTSWESGISLRISRFVPDSGPESLPTSGIPSSVVSGPLAAAGNRQGDLRWTYLRQPSSWPASPTLTSVGWIGYIIIGAIAGWIAGKLVKGGGSGFIMNIVIGIIGALIGGFLLSFWFDTAEGGWWFTLFTALLGSVILLWIAGMVQRKT